jgi:hypothetical protein
MDTAGSLFLPARQRVHRKRRTATTVLPAAPLVLVSAAYDPGAAADLTFDRAIDVAALDPASFVVSDGDYGFQYVGTGESGLLSPTTVRIVLVGIGEWSEPGITLSAGAANGIVAADDDAPWAGVTGLELPFPS